MGMIAKLRTSSRTATRTVPIAGSASSTEMVYDIDHLVRSAAAAVGDRGGVSTTHRGRTSGWAGMFGGGDVASTMWFEATSGSSWQISLGAATVGGNMLDWRIEIETGSVDGAPAVTVSTPEQLTRDGALERGKEHDLARAMIIGVLTGQRPRDDTAQERISAAGVTTPVGHPHAAPPPEHHQSAAITTALTTAEVEQRLAVLPETLEHRDGTTWRWAVGPELPSPATAQVTLTDRGTHRHLAVTLSYRRGSGSHAVDGSAFALLQHFPTLLYATLSIAGGNATLEPTGDQR